MPLRVERYKFVEVIGTGGMSVVWLAYDHELKRQLAVKVLAGHISHDLSIQQRFRREAQHIASMSHPNIVRIYDFEADDDGASIFMEYVDGQSLDQVLKSVGGPVPLPVTSRIAFESLSALDHAHGQGVIHRDIKPANLLVALDGRVKVADFGISKALSDTTEITVQGSFVGTATYASPEQLMGRPVGPASDLYSLGCVLYECLAGRPPFVAEDVQRLILQHRFAEPEPLGRACPEAPDSMRVAIDRALAKSPADRFESAASMRVAFSADGAGESVVWAELMESRQGSTIASTAAAPGRTTNRRAYPSISGTWPTQGTEDEPDHRFWLSPAHPKRAVLLGVTLVLVALVAISIIVRNRDHDHGSPQRQTGASVLPSGGVLQPGQALQSGNRQYRLVMQEDGNLVEYREKSHSPHWQSDTSGDFGAYTVMQSDGDLVVYPKGETSPSPGQPTPALWSSGTFGNLQASAELNNDGEIVVRSADKKSVLWES